MKCLHDYRYVMLSGFFPSSRCVTALGLNDEINAVSQNVKENDNMSTIMEIFPWLDTSMIRYGVLTFSKYKLFQFAYHLPHWPSFITYCHNTICFYLHCTCELLYYVEISLLRAYFFIIIHSINFPFYHYSADAFLY